MNVGLGIIDRNFHSASSAVRGYIPSARLVIIICLRSKGKVPVAPVGPVPKPLFPPAARTRTRGGRDHDRPNRSRSGCRKQPAINDDYSGFTVILISVIVVHPNPHEKCDSLYL